MQKYIIFLFTVCLLLGGCSEAAREAKIAEEARAQAEQEEQAAIELFDSFVYIDVESEFALTKRFEKGALEEAVELLKTAEKVSGVDTQNHTEVAMLNAKTPENNLYYTITKASNNTEKLYIQREEYIYDIDSFMVYNLFDRWITNDDYVYSEPPRAFMAVGAGEAVEMAVIQGSYYYTLLDSSQREVELAKAEPFVLAAQKDDKLEFDIWHLEEAEYCCKEELTAIITKDEKTLWQGAAEQLYTFKPEQSGLHIVEVSGKHSAKGYSEGEFIWQAVVDWQMPVEFIVESTEINPGELVVIRAQNVPKDEAVIFTSTDVVFKPIFFDDGAGAAITVIPFASSSALGDYSFKLTCGNVTEEYEITLKEKQFVVQNLTVSENVTSETINSDKANAEYRNAIVPIRPIRDPIAYWQEDFVWPVYNPNQRSTEFGTIRYVNGGASASRHNALDFNLPQGTDVYATNRGRVLFAGFLQLSGNTVVIEHGYGVKSWYYHMDSLTDIKADDIVECGQKIGEIGSTGFSTGPHLHFEITVTNIAVNPETVITDKLLTKLS